MTDLIFFDTDCISSFLWTDQEVLLTKLYGGRIILPEEVFRELSNPSIPHIRRKVIDLVSARSACIKEILVNTEEFDIYHDLAISSETVKKRIGKGEAAAIALAKVYDGTLASNNMKDIGNLVSRYGLRHITTGSILSEALDKGLIDEQTGNQIWASMLQRRRILPSATFSDYLKSTQK